MNSQPPEYSRALRCLRVKKHQSSFFMFKILIFYKDDEVENYGPIRGTITFYFAKILNFLSCGLYIYEIPVAVQSIRFGKNTQV